MKRKAAACLMALTMVLGLTACGSGNAAPPAENADSQAADNVQEEDRKSVV